MTALRLAIEDSVKRCSRCKEPRPRAAFASDKAALDGLQARCRECWAAKGRAGRLRRNYGLTESERDAMVASQKGLCVICPKAPAVHVDHCHKTGRVRGVLCFNCNSAIGKLGDVPDAVRRAAAYLEGNSWKPILVAPGVYQLPS
ncbi:endonuclease VII domain-containing protein [Streptomyces sp. NPDC058964]|uniref:endonuclease VII domain-containing protein n=1 Tax=Streptomyces sp. NPDC058964 TaxID=3346681 RepID=UPI0036C0FE9D